MFIIGKKIKDFLNYKLLFSLYSLFKPHIIKNANKILSNTRENMQHMYINVCI